MTVDKVGRNDHRTTFVMSLEDERPLEPNCHDLIVEETPKIMRKNLVRDVYLQLSCLQASSPMSVFILPQAKARKLAKQGLNKAMKVVPLDAMDIPNGRKDVKVVEDFDAGIGLKIRMSLPEKIEGRKTYLTRWGRDQVILLLRCCRDFYS